MPYFSVRHYPGMPLVVVSVTATKPQKQAKDGLTTFYVAPLSEEAARGAETYISDLDLRMGSSTKHHGIYQASLDDVWTLVQEAIKANSAIKRHPMPLRVAAGVTAVLLTAAFCFCVTLGTVFWLFVSAFKRQSGLVTMAETAVLWSIFDWRPLIRKLGRIALGK